MAAPLTGMAGVLAGFFGIRTATRGRGEGFTLVGLAAFIAAVALAAGGTAVEMSAIHIADAGAAEEMAAAVLGAGIHLGAMSWLFWWIGVTAMSLGMWRSGGWPRWLAGAGIAVGVACIAVTPFLGQYGMLYFVGLLGFVWLGITGAVFMRAQAIAPAAAPPEPRVGAGF
jgi:hypothetical protein